MSAIEEGIRLVAIGKEGRHDCSKDLVLRIVDELNSGDADPIHKAAFFTALWLKGLSEDERLFELCTKGGLKSAENLAQYLLGSSIIDGFNYCVRALNGEEFGMSEIQELGSRLFSSHSDFDIASTILSTALRVRHATMKEYEGLFHAMNHSLIPLKHKIGGNHERSLLLSEPTDGVERTFILSPLIADLLSHDGYHVYQSVAPACGPKSGYNLYDIKLHFERRSKGSFENELSHDILDNMINLHEVAPYLSYWMKLRRKMLKRPFVATLEKYLNPCSAKYLITTAFHHRYQEMGVEIAEKAGYDGVIVFFRTLESTLISALGKTTRVIASVKKSDGRFERKTFEFCDERGDLAKSLKFFSLEENVELIKTFYKTRKTTGSGVADEYLWYSYHNIKKILDWMAV